MSLESLSFLKGKGGAVDLGERIGGEDWEEGMLWLGCIVSEKNQ